MERDGWEQRNTRWAPARPTASRAPNSPQQLVLNLGWALTLQAGSSSAVREQGWRFSRVTKPRQCLLPLYTPGPDQKYFYQVLKLWDLSCWLEKMALVHTGTKEKNMAKTDPPGLESHCLCRTPRQNSGKQTVPSKMLLSYYVSFLPQKEHALLHTVLRKGKN